MEELLKLLEMKNELENIIRKLNNIDNIENYERLIRVNGFHNNDYYYLKYIHETLLSDIKSILEDYFNTNKLLEISKYNKRQLKQLKGYLSSFYDAYKSMKIKYSEFFEVLGYIEDNIETLFIKYLGINNKIENKDYYIEKDDINNKIKVQIPLYKDDNSLEFIEYSIHLNTYIIGYHDIKIDNILNNDIDKYNYKIVRMEFPELFI